MEEKANEPLIFIDSAKVVKDNNKQTVYDSRYQPRIKLFEVENKIDSLASLATSDNQVLFKMKKQEIVEGILVNKDQEYIYYKEKGLEQKTKIKDILDIELLRM